MRIFATIFAASIATATSAQDVAYDVGDTLTCPDGVVLIVGATDAGVNGDSGAHVQMYFAGDFLAGHLPFVASALAECSPDTGGDWQIDRAGFDEGFGQWQDAKGGYFTVSTSEVAVMMLELTGQ